MNRIAEKVIDAGGVFVGWRTIGYPKFTSLFVVRKTAEVNQLIVNPLCVDSPVRLILNLVSSGVKKLGCVLRLCHLRALIQCMNHGQIRPDRIYVHLVRCKGIVDLRKLRAVLKQNGVVDSGEFDSEIDSNLFVLKQGGRSVFKVSLKQLLDDVCYDCKAPERIMTEQEGGLHLDGMDEGAMEPPSFDGCEGRDDRDVSDDWMKIMGNCILCRACQRVCPQCFCDECVFDRKMKEFVNPWFFHLVRVYHLSGRCTVCGQCGRSCPMALPLRSLMSGYEAALKEEFSFKGAGLSCDGVSATVLTKWSEEDRL